MFARSVQMVKLFLYQSGVMRVNILATVQMSGVSKIFQCFFFFFLNCEIILQIKMLSILIYL